MGTRLIDTEPGAVAYRILRALLWGFTHLVCSYHVRGREHVPLTGPLLIVANHLSWYDPLLLGVILPRRAWFMTKVQIFRWPIIGWLVQITGQIPVQRAGSDRAALEKALACLRTGKAVVIFPEGTVERQERMIAAHAGAAMLALRTGVTVLPVAHTGTRRVLRFRGRWFPHVDVKIGTPYVPELPQGTVRKENLQVVTNEMMHHIAALLPAEVRGVYNDR
jgi:1-acyl-sn-glycerol-3-phosphate acyltransferase